MPNARTTSGGLRFNLKRQRNSSPERGSDISSSLRYTKRYRAVYELDSDDELVERIHISSDGEPEDDINHGQIVFEEMASEVVEYLDITVDSTPIRDETEPEMTQSSGSEKSRGKKRVVVDQQDTKDGETERHESDCAPGHAGLDNVQHVEDNEESLDGPGPTTQREPISAGEHEHRRHLRLYHTPPPPNSYDSSTGTFYNTYTSGSSSSSASQRVETRVSDCIEATTPRVPCGGKSLQALMTVVPIEWAEEENDIEIIEDCVDEAESVDDDSKEEEVAVAAQISLTGNGMITESPQGVVGLSHEVEDWFRSFLGDDALNPFSPTDIPDTCELSGLLEPNHEFGIDFTGTSSFTWASDTDEAALTIQRLSYE